MIRRFLLLIAISALLSFTSSDAFSQSSPAAIQGFVTDLNNNPVPNATISLYGEGSPPTAPALTAQTDASGFYAFDNVSPGNYSLSASRDNYLYTATTDAGNDTAPVNMILPMRLAAA